MLRANVNVNGDPSHQQPARPIAPLEQEDSGQNRDEFKKYDRDHPKIQRPFDQLIDEGRNPYGNEQIAEKVYREGAFHTREPPAAAATYFSEKPARR